MQAMKIVLIVAEVAFAIIAGVNVYLRKWDRAACFYALAAYLRMGNLAR